MKDQLVNAALAKIRALNKAHIKDIKKDSSTTDAGDPTDEVHLVRRKRQQARTKIKGVAEGMNKEGCTCTDGTCAVCVTDKTNQNKKTCCADGQCPKCIASMRKNMKPVTLKDGSVIDTNPQDNADMSFESTAEIVLRVLDEQYMGKISGTMKKMSLKSKAANDDTKGPLPKSSKVKAKDEDKWTDNTGDSDSTVTNWLNKHVTHKLGKTKTAQDAYEHYTRHCEKNDQDPIPLPTFGRHVMQHTHSKNGGLQKAKVSGRVRYIDMHFKPHSDDE